MTKFNCDISDLHCIPSELFFDFFIQKAIKARASDVHFEPTRRNMRVRFRIDGKLQTIIETEKLLGDAVLSKIKLKTNLKLDCQFMAQDGRLCVKFENKIYDIRVSTLPVMYGEDIVLRIFNQEDEKFSIENIGLSLCVRTFIDEVVKVANGLVLISGATGSGKTTTLYSILQQLINKDQKIISIEDPVEYKINGVCQIAVNEKIGLTFANILRSVLRQAPNIIIVGEIRDQESANLVIQAALTGHLVLSTIHSDTASGALTRLKDFGINEFLINSALRGVISQRLLVRPCAQCSSAFQKTQNDIDILRERADDIDLITCSGCDKCCGHGYHGRIGLFELIKAFGVDYQNIKFKYVETFCDDSLSKLKTKSVFFDDVKSFLLTKQ